MDTTKPPGRWGPWDGPPAVIEYGPSGLGKSSRLGWLLGSQGVVFALPGATKPFRSTCGFEPNVIEVNDLAGVIQGMQALFAALPVEKRPNIGIDDLTELAKATAEALKPKYAPNGVFSGDATFRYWDDVKAHINAVKSLARHAGVLVAANAHLIDAEVKNGKQMKGGPDMPARKVVDAIPHMFDVCVRIEADVNRLLFKAVYKCDNGHPVFHEKDRHNVLRATSPANMAEALRRAGYPIARPRGLEWQESWVEQIAAELAASDGKPDTQKKLFKAAEEAILKALLGGKKDHDPADTRPSLWAYGAIQDGRDRWELRKQTGSMLGF